MKKVLRLFCCYILFSVCSVQLFGVSLLEGARDVVKEFLDPLDLRYCDLRGEELIDLGLQRLKLQGALLQGARLSEQVVVPDYSYFDRTLLFNLWLDGNEEEKRMMRFLMKAGVNFFRGVDNFRLHKINWAEENLQNVDLSGANLRGIDFSGVNLSGTNLSGADLFDANLSRANLTRANLTRANLRGCNLMGAIFLGTNLSKANLSEADLTGASLKDVNFFKAKLSHACLIGSFLVRVDLVECDLSQADLSGARLFQVNLTRADLSFACLVKSHLSESCLLGANFLGTNLLNAHLDKVWLRMFSAMGFDLPCFASKELFTESVRLLLGDVGVEIKGCDIRNQLKEIYMDDAFDCETRVLAEQLLEAIKGF